jgi:flagellar biogenesis protein FliO
MPRFTLSAVTLLTLCLAACCPPASGQNRSAPTAGSASVRPQEKAIERASGARSNTPIAVPPPKRSQRGADGRVDKPTTAGNMGAVVLSSLAIVLGLFFFVVWLSRRAFPKATAPLSTEVLEIVGRSPLAARHQLQLIRLGRRLLLVSVTPEHAETLTELTDPDEVNHLVGLCRQQQAGSITDSFRQVLHQLGSTTKSRSDRAAADELELTDNTGRARR